METLNRLIQLTIDYLEQSTQPVSGLDWFNQYGIPIIQTLVLLGGAIAGLYKYYSVKNKEINEKMLKEVYAPLYQYFIKQELFCYISKIQRDYKESPILELTSKRRTEKVSFGDNTKYTIDTSYETVLELNRKEFLKVLNCVNIGLASKELFTLLNMYSVLIYIEETAEKTSDKYLDATIMKVDVENALREEIIKGYKYYHRKLKLETITKNKFYQIKDDNIEFIYKVDENIKKELLEKIKKNPEKF